MPRNGSGTFNPPASTWNPGVNGVTATTADYNAQLTDISAAITQSVSSDGQTPMTGNLPMGNNKITGLALGTANTDSASMANLNAVAGQAGGVGDRNLLINGNFALNQRVYATGTPTVAGNQYTLDRWRVVTSGQSIAFGAAAPDRVVTCPAGGIEQPIEAGMMVGGVYTLSWTGTATAAVNGVAITNGGNTGALPANTIATVKFSSGTVTNAQFEFGAAATPYQRRPLATELMLCQRYYSKSYNMVTTPGTAGPLTNGIEDYGFVGLTPTAMLGRVKFPVWMRTAAPTVRVWDGAGVISTATTFTGAGVQQNNQTVTVDNFSEAGFKVFCSINNPARLLFHWDASAEL